MGEWGNFNQDSGGQFSNNPIGLSFAFVHYSIAPILQRLNIIAVSEQQLNNKSCTEANLLLISFLLRHGLLQFFTQRPQGEVGAAGKFLPVHPPCCRGSELFFVQRG